MILGVLAHEDHHHEHEHEHKHEGKHHDHHHHKEHQHDHPHVHSSEVRDIPSSDGNLIFPAHLDQSDPNIRLVLFISRLTQAHLFV